MVSQYTSTFSGSATQPTVFGFIRIRAKYEFRGRQLDTAVAIPPQVQEISKHNAIPQDLMRRAVMKKL